MSIDARDRHGDDRGSGGERPSRRDCFFSSANATRLRTTRVLQHELNDRHLLRVNRPEPASSINRSLIPAPTSRYKTHEASWVRSGKDARSIA
jgi:hypothetical protein